jgi:hypothetical protein
MRPKPSWSYLAVAFFSVLLLLIAAAPVVAQTTQLGTITGTVTDSTGAVVPEASVSIKDLATGNTRSATTNSAGRYVFINVNPGKYDVTISKPGFAKIAIPGDVVEVGTVSTNNVVLKVGSESQTIEVATSGVELQTDNTTIGNTVSGIALQSLPSIARDTSTFLALQPGISPDGSVAGTVVDQSTFQLDGGNNTNDMDGSMSVYTPSYAGDPTGGVANQSLGLAAGATGVMPTPADSVEEFKVSTAGQGADFNSSSGAQVQIVTKRGTNDWHGTAYEYYLDNNLNANTWQNNFNGIPNPSYHYNRFGGAIGGPIIPKKILGGKTYFFANYQGFRWPNSTTKEIAVPSDSMRLGLLQFGGNVYNLNPYPVTYKGVQYSPSQCPGGPCDPRGLGINPLISQLWNKYMPLSNETGCSLSRCDGLNILGYTGNMSIPQNDNFGVVRVDHDFGDKWHFMGSYRYYSLTRATTDQYDVGGFFPGHTLGTFSSLTNHPQQPWYLVAGMTTQISSNVTNNFVYSYLRNYWSWASAGDPAQFAGLGGALEPLGESATQALAPYNVNTQQTRTRSWNGHNNMFRDDVTWLKGKHQIQFGGLYQHNWDAHQRTDNGGGINYYPVYQMTPSSGSSYNMAGFVPADFSGSRTSYSRDYAAILGLVGISQVAYTRSGKDLNLNPPLTPASTEVTIPFYNFYGQDSWRVSQRVTLSYGLGWSLEMPPKESNGSQVIFVGPDNNPISTTQYLNARQSAALAGDVYNPQVGFTLIGNLANPRTYPYNPYYGQWSPRVGLAWDIFGDGRSVLRGGYGLTYGRLNGVNLVLVPLLGTGLIQPVQCFSALANGQCAGQGAGSPAAAFRIGTDGLVAPLPAASPTLPQPLYPGVNGIAAGAGEALDPNFRPNRVQSFTLTFQRQLSNKVSMEVGYIGRLISHEYSPVNLNAVPYMMTKGGQTFAKAYANAVIGYCGNGDVRNMGGGNCIGNAAAVAPQPFFEAALSGTGFCNGYSNCTQAVLAKEGNDGTGYLSNQSVWSLYSDLDNGGFNFPRSMMNTPLNCPTGTEIGCSGQLTSGVGMNASLGHGNYNAMFISVKTSEWNGVSFVSNFTWSKSLGTGAEVQATSADTLIDPFNINTGYGLQAFDRTLVYNLYMVYQPKWFRNQQGFLGHLLGGWTIAPIFATGSGLPITLGTINGGGQAFGEGDSANFLGYGNSENAIIMGSLPKPKAYYNVAGSNEIGTSGFGLNIFQNPQATWLQVRQPILGYDVKDGGFGVYRGLNYWNMDLSVKKLVKITERFSVEGQFVFANIFNHNQLGDPTGDYLDTSNPGSWGTLPGTVTDTTPRQIEFGVRVNF